jgi:hypothetical protein
VVSSAATSVPAYLASLPPDRREVVRTIRDLVNTHLPKGYEEVMQYGMISWVVPFSTYPITYNKQPIAYIALASQSQKVSLYLMGAYMFPDAKQAIDTAFASAGKRLDMGKSCLRFRTLDQLPPLGFLEPVIKRCTPAELIAIHETVHGKPGEARGSRETKRERSAALVATLTATSANRSSAASGKTGAKTAAKKAAKTTTTRKAPTKQAARSGVQKRAGAPKASSGRGTTRAPAAKKSATTRAKSR